MHVISEKTDFSKLMVGAEIAINSAIANPENHHSLASCVSNMFPLTLDSNNPQQQNTKLSEITGLDTWTTWTTWVTWVTWGAGP